MTNRAANLRMSVCANFIASRGIAFIWVFMVSLVDVGSQDLSESQLAFKQGYSYHVGEEGEPDLEMAVRYYRHALKIDPNMYESHSNAGRAYYALEKYREAQFHYGKAIEIARIRNDISAENEARDSADLATCYLKVGQEGKCEQWLNAAIRKYPGLVEAHYNLINLMFRQQRLDEAKKAMVRAKELAPSLRYDLLAGRLEGRESQKEWNPLWVKVVFVGMIVAVAGMFVLRALKRQ